MYSESDIEGAVQAGALTPEAAAAFRRHVAAGHGEPAVDEEHFRLLTGFNDIFVSIALVLLFAALAQIGGKLTPGLGGLFVAGAAWPLAEYFTARRRMALPSILLLLGFVGGIGAAVIGLATTIWPNLHDNYVGGVFAVAGLAAAGAAALHWRRFVVPITVAAGTAALVAMVVGIVVVIAPAAKLLLFPMLLVGGLAVFAVAMWWDMSDPQRRTRRADVAFWLHLVAAPLIAHALFNLIGVFGAEMGVGVAVVVLAMYLAFGFVALAIDRRALLVSSLAYVLYAMYALFRSAGAIELSAAFTAFVIGSALLTLSAFWHPIRRRVVATLGGLAMRLPPAQMAGVS
ncbi:MAG: hypothetical protein OSB00_12925 [Sphingomonas bacterium]|nr:hypothetical protein [Sphingomonas bacterium]